MLLRRLAAAAAAVVVLAATTAHARGQLQPRQTSVELPAGARAGRLVLANAGDSAAAAQVRVYAWSQDGREDRLDPTNALVVSPAIVEIAPGAEQLVRVVRTSTLKVEQEQAYRIVVDELPGDAADATGSAVTVRMRYVIPAFVRIADPAPVALQCRIDQADLSCSNRGGRAAQLGASHLVTGDGRAYEITPGLLGYVLAGSSRRFPLDAGKLAGLGARPKLEVRLNGQPAILDLHADR